MTDSLTNSRPDAAELLNLFDYAGRAERSLPPAVLDRIAEGLPRRGMDERSRHVFNSIMLRPRVLSDVSNCATDRDVVGGHIQLPVIGGGATAVDPSDSSAGRDIVRAAGQAGTIQVVSARWGPDIDELAGQVNLWLRLPLLSGADAMAAQLDRAARAGYRALVLDLDAGSDPAVDASATWDSIAQVQGGGLPVILQGIVRPEDADRAAEHGAAGVVVSCLPRVPQLLSAIDALAEVSEAVAGRCDVYLAGGVRRGIDVLKAMALGAKACLIDRPVAYAQALHGEAGVVDLYQILRGELSYAMETCGIPSPEQVTRDIVAVPELSAVRRADA